MPTSLGEYLKTQREKSRISLRQFAIKIGLDPAYYSRIERGEVAPPGEAVLTKIAGGLGIHAPSDEFTHLETLCDVDRGRWPTDLAENEDLAALLPAFYAKLRQERPTDAAGMYNIYRSIVSGRNDAPHIE